MVISRNRSSAPIFSRVGYSSRSRLGVVLISNFNLSGFIDLGYRLFRDKDSPSVPPFVVGDVFDTSFFNPAAPLSAEPLNLRATTSLTPLKGKLRAIHAGSFFHLFDEETQVRPPSAFPRSDSELRGEEVI